MFIIIIIPNIARKNNKIEIMTLSETFVILLFPNFIDNGK